nr:hypothetical protein [Tanacetum cinerariifolium]
MGNLSQKKVVSEQVENVDKIRVYNSNNHDDKGEFDDGRDKVHHIGEEKLGIMGEKFMDDNVCNVSPSVICLVDECVNVDAHGQDNYDQFCSMNDTNPVTNEESSLKISHMLILCKAMSISYFKFNNQKGMDEVLAKGLWIVSNKPMIIQKWDLVIGMKAMDVTRIPVWAKLMDVPLEAWTKEGISALASILGKPIRMDNITAQNCKDGRARAEYARVLVEFDVNKGFKEEICIQYRSKDKIKGIKKVKVEYVWKPHICTLCKVFGHKDEKCSKLNIRRGLRINRMIEGILINAEEGKEMFGIIMEDGIKEAEEYTKKDEDVLIGENIAAQRCFANIVNEKEASVLNCQIFVYALNKEKERRILWDEISAAKIIADENPWCLLGDLNVTINVEEYSSGGSSIDEDMQEFIDCINEVEVEDIHSSYEFIPIVKEGWEEAIEGHNMFKVVKKLKNLKYELKKLAWKNEEADCLSLYMEAIGDEKSFMLQKTKLDWISKEDRNTKFFHKVIKSKENLNKITSVCNAKGEYFEGNEKISHDDAEYMVRDVTEEEIKEEMFGIQDNKAPGPDGYTLSFFKKAWKVIGKDICLAIQDFFKNGKLLGELYATIISLILKVQQPNKISNFRLIACCNVLYKCISKILTTRIKSSLDNVGNLNQSAFIPGRIIQDNLMLSQELLKGYNCKNEPSRCALKIDIAKAYDTVNWIFFGNDIKVSGRELRQRDPISPYLFTIVMEVFSLILASKVKRSNVFKSHKGCRELKMTHLSFADDLLVFCHGDVNSIYVIKDTLLEFSRVSGLLPNLGKSVIFFGSVKENDKMAIMQALPFKVDKLPVKYLGIPLLAKRLGIKDCTCLVDKVKNRVMDWKNKSLSYAGRLQLIALVLSAMQAY